MRYYKHSRTWTKTTSLTLAIIIAMCFVVGVVSYLLDGGV